MGPGILWTLILADYWHQTKYSRNTRHSSHNRPRYQDSLPLLPWFYLTSLFTDHGAGQFCIRSGANNSCPSTGSHGIISVVSSVPAVRKHLSLLVYLEDGMRGLEERLIVSRTGMRVRQWERTLSRSCVTPSITSRSLITDYCYIAVIETDQETPETIMSFVSHIRHQPREAAQPWGGI